MTWLATRECLKLPATCNCLPHVGKEIPAEGLALTDLSIFNWVSACSAFPRRLAYFLQVEIWALFQNVLQVLSQLLDPDLACDKCSVVRLLATCNCLLQAGKEISAEGQVPNGSGHLKTGAHQRW